MAIGFLAAPTAGFHPLAKPVTTVIRLQIPASKFWGCVRLGDRGGGGGAGQRKDGEDGEDLHFLFWRKKRLLMVG